MEFAINTRFLSNIKQMFCSDIFNDPFKIGFYLHELKLAN